MQLTRFKDAAGVWRRSERRRQLNIPKTERMTWMNNTERERERREMLMLKGADALAANHSCWSRARSLMTSWACGRASSFQASAGCDCCEASSSLSDARYELDNDEHEARGVLMTESRWIRVDWGSSDPHSSSSSIFNGHDMDDSGIIRRRRLQVRSTSFQTTLPCFLDMCHGNTVVSVHV